MHKTIQIGLLGLGTVGSRFVENFTKHSINKNASISKILLQNIDKKRTIDTASYNITTDPKSIIEDSEIDIIIELIGGEQPALDYILAAIKNRKIVITANKCVMAIHGEQILSLAKQYQTPVLYEASVAGGIPIIRTIINSLQSIKINGFVGICNGTSNYILSNMLKNKMSFDDALREAQDQGFAESDPKSDVEGYDAAYKATILSSLCFRHFSDFNQVYIEGIKDISLFQLEQAEALNYAIKPIIFAKKHNNNIQLGVFMALVAKDNILASVDGVENIVQINSNLLGQLSYIGLGAGGDPTTASVLSDLINVICDSNIDLHYYEQYTSKYSYVSIDESDFKFFIVLTIDLQALNKTEVVNFVKQILAHNQIKINQISIIDQDLQADYGNIVIISDNIKNKHMSIAKANLINTAPIIGCNYIRILE